MGFMFYKLQNILSKQGNEYSKTNILFLYTLKYNNKASDCLFHWKFKTIFILKE